MPFGATGQSVAFAAAVCAPAALVIGGVMQAGIFHRYQKLTPSTWRKEGPTQYALGAGARLLAGLAFPLLFAYTGMAAVMPEAKGDVVVVGLKFGVLAWAALALPIILAATTFVNVHRMFALGLLLDWLLVSCACGVACAWLVKWIPGAMAGAG